jgi:LPS-assembly lipoprotein
MHSRMPTRRRTAFAHALIFTTAVLLSGCGFHLRGSGGEANLPFQTMYLGLPESSPLGIELKRNIRAGGTRIVADAKDADAIIEVLSENREEGNYSLNSQGRIREYTLYYKVTVRVKGKADKELLPATEIVLKRDISFNESQVLAKDAEKALLYRDMQADLVQQVIRRMAVLKPAT